MYYVTLTYLHVIVEYMALASFQMADHAGILQETPPFYKKIMKKWPILDFFRSFTLVWPGLMPHVTMPPGSILGVGTPGRVFRDRGPQPPRPM